MTLKAALEALSARVATDLVHGVLEAMKGASLRELLELSGAQSSSATAKHAERAPATRGKRRRRTAADFAKTLDLVVGALNEADGGLRSEQIQKALGLAKDDVTPALTLGLEQKVLTKKGQKRSTTYFAK